jgi:phospho-N-acetylmuramoyl-pentapeptide-transferase
MYKLFGILILSAIFTGILMVPFINLLYRLKFRTPHVSSVDQLGRKTIFNKLQGHKEGTPLGGGILLMFAWFLFTLFYYLVTDYYLNWTTWTLFITMILFGMLGFYDDWMKFFGKRDLKMWAFSFKYKLFAQIIFGLLIGWLLYTKMGHHMVNIPILSVIWDADLDLGWWYIPFAALTIVSSSNAFNITDGLDGLSCGLLFIALAAFWVLTGFSPFGSDVAVFIATLMGTLLIFLYFNIHPARIILGDTGALAFGAVLAVVALMLNQSLILPVIGAIFVAEGASSLIQIFSFRFRKGKRVFKIAPLHHHFQAIGWDETKVVMRFWLAGLTVACIGLFLATFGQS